MTALIFACKPRSTSSSVHGELPNAKDTTSNTEVIMDATSLDNRILRKAECAIRNRTSRLIIVIERCTNDHNYSAILRTAEALGVQYVYIISPQSMQSTLDEEEDGDGSETNATLKRSTGQVLKNATKTEVGDRHRHHLFAQVMRDRFHFSTRINANFVCFLHLPQNACEWLTVRDFDTTKECLDKLRSDGYQIWATDLGQAAVPLTTEDLKLQLGNDSKLIPDRLAIVFGTEAVGCSTEMLTSSDLRVYLPLRGFADSLNLSVATALVVHHLFILDPTIAGGMSEAERKELRTVWFPKLASQRLLSAKDKKRRQKLIHYLRTCDDIERDMRAGKYIEETRKKKLSMKDAKQSELDDIDAQLQKDSQVAAREFIDDPPSPLSDMRRADEHRVCYVGKNTKAKASEAWSNLPATNKYKYKEMSSAATFRNALAKSR